MKKILALLLITMVFTWVSAQEEASNDTAPAEMQAMLAHMKTGPMHKMLADTVGDWKVSWTMWMAPGAPPVKTEGECTNEMILGGRYLRSKYKGSYMGTPVDALNIIGYDNSRDIFASVWIESTSTSIAYAEGTFDKETNTVEFEGFGTDPVSKKKHKYWANLQMENNKQVMVMYFEEAGQKFKTMEAVYTRK
jgi:hypothetical protein